MGSPRTEEYVTCPCCRYPTLPERGGYDICCLCNSEDDGQDDTDADEVRGGPNGSYSLSEARENFRRYWVMYTPDRDTRICPDSEIAVAAKKTIARAFESMKGADKPEVVRLWGLVRDARAVLDRELKDRIEGLLAAAGSSIVPP
jgi:hypothetical protein